MVVELLLIVEFAEFLSKVKSLLFKQNVIDIELTSLTRRIEVFVLLYTKTLRHRKTFTFELSYIIFSANPSCFVHTLHRRRRKNNVNKSLCLISDKHVCRVFIYFFLHKSATCDFCEILRLSVELIYSRKVAKNEIPISKSSDSRPRRTVRRYIMKIYIFLHSFPPNIQIENFIISPLFSSANPSQDYAPPDKDINRHNSRNFQIEHILAKGHAPVHVSIESNKINFAGSRNSHLAEREIHTPLSKKNRTYHYVHVGYDIDYVHTRFRDMLIFVIRNIPAIVYADCAGL